MQSTQQKYPVAIFELIPISRTGSGFVREDTVNTADPIRIIHPKNRVIMNESIVRKPSEKTPGTFVNVPTRYIYNQEEIFVDKQDAEKMKTSIRDKIVFINGFITVPKDGAFVGLYEFLKNHAQNASNPNRVESLQVVFKEIQPEKNAHDSNIHDYQLAEALGFIKKLVKEKGGEYEYDEDTIDVMCNTFGVYAESPSQKVSALITFAKSKPVDFLELAKKGQQTVNIEVKHALQLKLIRFEGNAAFYNEGENPKIKSFSNVQNTEEKKILSLGAYFQKVEGKEAYELFKERLSAAKEAAVIS